MAKASTPIAPREEAKIFSDLGTLCVEPGFAHAIAAFCFRDNTIRVGEALKGESMAHMFSFSRLSRTEISTLIGLMARQPIDLSHPGPKVIQACCDRAEALLHELHRAMSAVWFEGIGPEQLADPDFNPFARGSSLREPIFYGGESAYSFQYRDLAVEKYRRDDRWLREHRGFEIATARRVVRAVGRLQNRKLFAHLESLRDKPQAEWTLLPGFLVSAPEVAAEAGLTEALVTPVFEAFALADGERNVSFDSLQDYNVTNAAPLIPVGGGVYLLFQNYSLAEAIYEGPFYWMGADTAYKNTALAHRGAFTEQVAYDFLRRVYGPDSVFSNVTLPAAKGVTKGEIDVLVLFGDRAIVVQAKSKRLTIEARKGNDLLLKDDFKKAIQDACDQAISCGTELLKPGCRLIGSDGAEIRLRFPLKEVFPICLVADHYPALSFQARQFLEFKPAEGIAAPLVSDVFALDAMTEMLTSPLRFLSYLSLRAQAADRILVTQELTLLGYHLRNNLWLSAEHDLIVMHEDLSSDLDAAMIVRREGLPGARTPEGILTRLTGLSAERLLAWIDSNPDPALIAFGLFLQEVDEDTFRSISKAMDNITATALSDGQHHDATFVVGDRGITMHANFLPDAEARPQLADYCRRRKYVQKANAWFGFALDPKNGALRFGLTIREPWTPDSLMDTATAGMSAGQKFRGRFAGVVKRKIGRNDPCPCGSGRKHKMCCLAQ